LVDTFFGFGAAFGDFLGIPEDLTLWELANSEFIIAAATLAIGLVINRRVGRIGEKVDDGRLKADLTHQLENRAPAPEPEAMAAPVPAPSVPQARSSTGIAESDAEAAAGGGDVRKPGATYFEKRAKVVGGAHTLEKLKEDLDAVAENVSAGRLKRKYSNLGKQDYRVRILALEDDGVISAPVAAELLAAFETWQPYSKNAVEVPDSVIAQIERAREILARNSESVRRRRRR
jgi:hypothetical protein